MKLSYIDINPHTDNYLALYIDGVYYTRDYYHDKIQVYTIGIQEGLSIAGIDWEKEIFRFEHPLGEEESWYCDFEAEPTLEAHLKKLEEEGFRQI